MKNINTFINLVSRPANAMADEVLLADNTGKILFANNSFIDKTSWSLKDLKNKPVINFINFPPLQKPESLFHSDVFLLREFELKYKDGVSLIREGAIFQLTFNDELFAGMAIVFQTESKQNTKISNELHKNVFLKIINYRKDAIWFSSDMINRQTLFITDTIHSICGWTTKEFYKGGWMFFLSLLSMEDLNNLMISHTKWLQEKNKIGRMLDHIPYHNFVSFRCRHGQYKKMDVEYTVQARHNGQVHLIFGSYRPIPESVGLSRDLIKQINGKTFIDLDYIKNSNTKVKPLASLHGITPREQQILELLADGLSSDDIAQRLHLSKHTVNTHRKQILKKFKGKNMADVVKKYISAQ